jgi:CRP/FNR family cyclic AMP-dependent transcriptional regulator
MDDTKKFDGSQSGIFEDISGNVIEQLCAAGRKISVEAGHVLFERGQDADELMILQEGVVELFFPIQIMGVTRAVTMQSNHAGDVVAWSSLVNPYCLTLSAKCASKCTLNVFSRNALHAYFETDARTGYLFMRNLAGVIGRRLQSMQTTWMHDLQASIVKGLE